MPAIAVLIQHVRDTNAPIAVRRQMHWPYRGSPMEWMWCCWWVSCGCTTTRRWMRFIKNYSSSLHHWGGRSRGGRGGSRFRGKDRSFGRGARPKAERKGWGRGGEKGGTIVSV